MSHLTVVPAYRLLQQWEPSDWETSELARVLFFHHRMWKSCGAHFSAGGEIPSHGPRCAACNLCFAHIPNSLVHCIELACAKSLRRQVANFID